MRRLTIPRRFATALASGTLLLALAVGSALAQESEVRPLSPAQLDAQIRALRAIRVQQLMEKSRRKLAAGRERAVLVERAAKGDKRAKALLAKGERSRRPVAEPEAGVVGGRLSESAATRPNSPLAAQVVPTNVRASNPAGDGANAGQSEEHIAAHGDNVIVAWNDGQGFIVPGNGQGFGYSTDGGATFTDGGNPPLPPGYPAWDWSSDPVVSVNEKTGTFYYCGLADATAGTNAIGVALGHFVGAAFVWDTTYVVRELSNATNFLDKQWIAVDSLTNNAYITYSNFDAGGVNINFQRSLDGGRTWQAAQVASAPLDNGFVQGSRPAVGPNGEVYTMWSAIDQVTAADNYRFRSSTDFGATLNPEITITKYLANFGTGAPGFNRERGISFASLAVDRTTGSNRGRLYLSWAECFNQQDENFAGSGAKTEVEANNTAATASAFTLGNTLRGTLTSATDIDFFSVPLVAGQSIVLWADSLSTTIGYRLRVLAPIPESGQRLAFGGDLSPNSGTPSQAFILYTAPVAGTYFVVVSGVTGSGANARYRVRAVQGNRNAGLERGRDQRDAFVTSSATLGATWTTPVQVNTDPVGFDNFLPEIAVASDGRPYTIWWDHRDDTFGSRTHRYLSRSSDAGTTWETNQRVTSVQTNFTTSPTNIAPNMGDYNAIWGGNLRLHAAWADGRDADINVYSAAVRTDHAIVTCQADTTVSPNTTATFGWTLSNPNPLYQNLYFVGYTSERAWGLPGLPTPTNIPELSAVLWQQSVTVPDTAAAGTNQICLIMRNASGSIEKTCCFRVTVPQGSVSVGSGSTAFALRGAQPNPAFGRATIGFTLPRDGRVELEIYDLQGARVRTLVDGMLGAGAQSVQWDGRDDAGRPASTGAYFVRLRSAGQSATQRFMFMR